MQIDLRHRQTQPGFAGSNSVPSAYFFYSSTSTRKTHVAKKAVVSHDLVTRWGGDKAVMHEGFVAVPTAFLKYLATLGGFGLTPAEALFVLEIMAFKWDAGAPFPSYKTLATRMGVSPAYVRKLARNLEEKKFIRRVERTGTTNKFELQPLFDVLAEHVKQIDPKAGEPDDDSFAPDDNLPF